MLRPRCTYVTTFLVALGLLALCYNLLATFPFITSSLRTTLEHALPKENFCTKDIGDETCCALFVTAEPCVEQCREEHLDRETFQLTQEYDLCAEKCLADYTMRCVDDGAREGTPGEDTHD
ncbi:hypothetical protein BU23DRAFT_574428 [Bimuria novae-zelandiae CBS 107.79]|uniref:Uncharacterized protein n=1 Tax=Bimuria novae-zelandiae CBS 107.79 TaxID=1447943 RepID=A0A6A5UPQ3_9PLEO|nr:hypothetical protein BU23DRAFT_574428 [Bimuria novae-zelandiae CBS 107.79]